MKLEKRHDDVLREIFLIRPKKDKQRFYSMYCDGEVLPVQDQDYTKNLMPPLFFKTKDSARITEIVKAVFIGLKKNQILGASESLAQCVIAMILESKINSCEYSLSSCVANRKRDQATLFFGIPFETLMTADGSNEMITGFKFGAFTAGMRAMIAHKELFGPQKASSQDKHLSEPATWLMREPIDFYVISTVYDSGVSESLRSTYFGLVVPYLREIWESEFKSIQFLASSLGIPSFDLDRLLSLHGLTVDMDCKLGYQNSWKVLNYSADVIPAGISGIEGIRHRSNVLSKPIGSCQEIDPTLKTYTEYIHKAYIHNLNNRPSDAFLHYIIGLDLLLGGKSDPTRNVTRRASVICLSSGQIKFQDMKKKISELYGLRSKYVHRGTAIAEASVTDIEKVCIAATEALLALRASISVLEKDFTENRWFKLLDYLAAALDAGITAPEEHYIMAGLSPSSSISAAIH